MEADRCSCRASAPKWSPNKDYWDKARVPKLDKLVLLPLPEANARVAALRSGQVDWIEAPAPDAVESLKKARLQHRHQRLSAQLDLASVARAEGSPWNDIRVRKAANLAIDREGMKELLAGLMIPAEGFMPPGHQWFGKPTFKVKYDPAEAKKLLAEAGYSPSKPLVVKIADLAVGLGPDAAAADERVRAAEPRRGRHQGRVRSGRVEPADQHLARRRDRSGARRAATASTSPTSSRIRSPASSAICNAICKAPTGHQLGLLLRSRDGQAVRRRCSNTFDPKEQTEVLQKVHEKYVDDALFLMVTHDVNARAISPKVKGFVQAKNWFQDFSPITMDK